MSIDRGRRTAGAWMCLAEYLRQRPTPSITCPECGMTTYNLADIAEGYCGQCHDWTGSKQSTS